MAAITKTVTLYSNTTDKERRVAFPAAWHICGACEGSGGSSAYLGAFTCTDMREMDDDFREDYFAGRYDRPCETCGGSGKVLRVDRKHVARHGNRVLKAYLRAYDEQLRADREIDAIQAAERRMGA